MGQRTSRYQVPDNSFYIFCHQPKITDWLYDINQMGLSFTYNSILEIKAHSLDIDIITMSRLKPFHIRNIPCNVIHDINISDSGTSIFNQLSTQHAKLKSNHFGIEPRRCGVKLNTMDARNASYFNHLLDELIINGVGIVEDFRQKDSKNQTWHQGMPYFTC